MTNPYKELLYNVHETLLNGLDELNEHTLDALASYPTALVRLLSSFYCMAGEVSDSNVQSLYERFSESVVRDVKITRRLKIEEN